MTISNVTTSTSGLDTPADVTTTWTHTVTGTPRGILVLLVIPNDLIVFDAVSYGGTSLLSNEMTGSPVVYTGEDSRIAAFFLGNNTSLTGDQTVEFTCDFATESVGYCITMDADVDMQETNTATFESAADSSPGGSLTLNNTTSLCAQVFSSGRQIDDITELPGWTRLGWVGFGNESGDAHIYDTIGATNVTFGYTSALADDVSLLAVAVSESSTPLTISVPAGPRYGADGRPIR